MSFGGTGGIGGMLMDVDGAFVVKEAIEHVRRFTLGGLDHAGREGCEAVR